MLDNSTDAFILLWLFPYVQNMHPGMHGAATHQNALPWTISMAFNMSIDFSINFYDFQFK